MLKIYKEPAGVLQAAAEYFAETAAEAIADQGKFTVALSGGSSPKGLYELLASELFGSKVDWGKVYFFFGDERNVPANHPESNALMVKKALFDPLNISPEQVFAVDTSLEPKKAAAAYQHVIEQHFYPRTAIFDLILLGLGDNSHTASLFPGTDVLDEKEAGVREVFLPDQQVYRITVTAPLINQAKHIAFLVFGSSKAEAVHHILGDERDYRQYPAQLIQPASGDIIWFLDEAAASLVKH